jgi:tetratricopeptide (TPR) repeat protein
MSTRLQGQNANNNLMQSVFISYSWKDQPISMRIYYDLINSGARVWRDQVDGLPGINYEKEMFEQIEASDIFLLLDSQESRASYWVPQECVHFRELMKAGTNRKMAICLVRDRAKTHQMKEMFEGQNQERVFDFSKTEDYPYDNDGSYHDEICKLCEFLGIVYNPLSEIPNEKDFVDEISAVNIKDSPRELLRRDFETINYWAGKKSNSIEFRLKALITEAESLNIELITPYLSLAILLGEKKDLEGALAIFNRIKNYGIFKNDPRIYRGAGSCHFQLGDYDQALDNFQKAIELTNLPVNYKHKQCIDQVYLNKAETLKKLERGPEVFATLKELYLILLKDNRLYPTIYLRLSEYFNDAGNKEQQLHWLELAKEKFPADPTVNFYLAGYYFAPETLNKSIDHLQLATKLDPFNIQWSSELTAAYLLNNDKHRLNEEAKKCLSLMPVTSDDFYFQGQTHYLLGNKKRALENYELSGESRDYYAGIWDQILAPNELSTTNISKNTTMRKALLIGINDYEFAPLKGCANDAIALGEVLSRNYDGAPNFECKVKVSDNQNDHADAQKFFGRHFANGPLNKATLLRSIENLFQSECDLALLFFSGHGYESQLGGYLVAEDASTYNEGVDVSTIITLANRAKQIKEILIILDCCHSGQLGNIPMIDEDKALLRKGLSILTSSMGNQVSIETNGMGLFTSILIAGLNGAAADASGRVTAGSLFSCADRVLGAFDQRPMYKAHVTSLATLRIADPSVPIMQLRKITELFPDKNKDYALNKSYEPTEEPRDDENEAIFRILQRLASANLVKPVGEDHMYFAAIREKSCALTPIGKLYWDMIKNNRL